MPLKTGRGCKTKKCKSKAVSANIAELRSADKSRPKGKRRPMPVILAIAMRAVYGKRKKR